MYTKKEISKIKEEFWTAFGKYLSPVPSAEGFQINWVNYKTGIKDVRFYMEADNTKAVIGIRLSHPDKDIQQMYFKELEMHRQKLNGYLNEAWLWSLHHKDAHGKIISSISKELSAVNVFNREDWPSIISFLKPRIIALDAFWTDWKYSLEALQ